MSKSFGKNKFLLWEFWRSCSAIRHCRIDSAESFKEKSFLKLPYVIRLMIRSLSEVEKFSNSEFEISNRLNFRHTLSLKFWSSKIAKLKVHQIIRASVRVHFEWRFSTEDFPLEKNFVVKKTVESTVLINQNLAYLEQIKVSH